MKTVPEVRFVTVHGHRRAYVQTGSGPALLLLHGLACDHRTWAPVIEKLARRYTVIAPDLLGHGLSDKPRADYSVGGYANGMRDLLTILGIDKVTVVGHSLGGGVAMQFAYQFPERTERLVLVAPGGLGQDVSPAVRAISLEAFEWAMGVATLPGMRQVLTGALRTLARLPLTATRDLGEAAGIVDSFQDPAARRAIRHVVSHVVDLRGQVITMLDRAYLTEAMPLCVIWGADDMVIPPSHAEAVKDLAPGAQVHVIGNAGHFPHRDHPDRFVRIVNDFISKTEPAQYHRGRWRAMLKSGRQVHPHSEETTASSATA